MESGYQQIFNSKCSLWDKNQEFNLMFLKAQQNYFNDVLRVRRYVFLRDIYEVFGFPVTRKTLFAGWVYDLEKPICDNFIDFGMLTDGEEADIKLNFNAQEDITEWFKEES